MKKLTEYPYATKPALMRAFLLGISKNIRFKSRQNGPKSNNRAIAMTHETEILANESGTQYQGVTDKTGSTGTYPIIGIMTGQFRRGRFDKPMTITNANIRAMLGYDPKNPSYTAVQDALSQGVPSVQVLRLNDALVCENVLAQGRYYTVRPDGLDLSDAEYTRLMDTIFSSLQVTVNGRKYMPTTGQNNPVGKEKNGSDINITINLEEAINSLVVCAAIPFMIFRTLF